MADGQEMLHVHLAALPAAFLNKIKSGSVLGGVLFYFELPKPACIVLWCFQCCFYDYMFSFTQQKKKKKTFLWRKCNEAVQFCSAFLKVKTVSSSFAGKLDIEIAQQSTYTHFGAKPSPSEINETFLIEFNLHGFQQSRFCPFVKTDQLFPFFPPINFHHSTYT